MLKQVPKPFVFLMESDVVEVLTVYEFLFGVERLLGPPEAFSSGRRFVYFLPLVAVESGGKFLALFHFE